MEQKKSVPVLFLDIDGTVRKGKEELGRFVNGPEDVEVFPEAVSQMRKWKVTGGRIIGVSNQGGIALGYMTADQCLAAMQRTQQLCEGLFDEIQVCQHAPGSGCWCRKPRNGMLIAGLLELGNTPCDGRGSFFGAVLGMYEEYKTYDSLMVGDRQEDYECAMHAGIAFRWAKDWRAGKIDAAGSL